MVKRETLNGSMNFWERRHPSLSSLSREDVRPEWREPSETLNGQAQR